MDLNKDGNLTLDEGNAWCRHMNPIENGTCCPGNVTVEVTIENDKPKVVYTGLGQCGGDGTDKPKHMVCPYLNKALVANGTIPLKLKNLPKLYLNDECDPDPTNKTKDFLFL